MQIIKSFKSIIILNILQDKIHKRVPSFLILTGLLEESMLTWLDLSTFVESHLLEKKYLINLKQLLDYLKLKQQNYEEKRSQHRVHIATQ